LLFIVSSIAIGMVLFALKYDQEYQEEVKNYIRMNEFKLEEDEKEEFSQEEQSEEANEQLIEEMEEEHEEITSG